MHIFHKILEKHRHNRKNTIYCDFYIYNKVFTRKVLYYMFHIHIQTQFLHRYTTIIVINDIYFY